MLKLRYLPLLLFLAVPCGSENINEVTATPFGWFTPNVPTQVTQALNTAATWVAHGFVSIGSNALFVSTGCWGMSGITGTLGANDVAYDIYSSTVNANIAMPYQQLSEVTGTGTTGYVCINGLNVGTTQYNLLWLVVKNLNASPTLNFPTMSWDSSNSGPTAFGQNTGTGNGSRVTTTSGATWSVSNRYGTSGPSIGFSDGSYYGVPHTSNTAISGEVGSRVQGSKERGDTFTPAAGACVRMKCVSMVWAVNSANVGPYKYKLYQGTTLVDTTTPTMSTTTSVAAIYDWHPACFSTDHILLGNVQYRITFAEPGNADTGLNYIGLPSVIWSTQTWAQNIKPWSMQDTFFDGSSWTNGNNVVPLIIMGDTVTGEVCQTTKGSGASN